MGGWGCWGGVLWAQVVIKGGLDADVTLSVPNHPTDASKGERKLVLTKVAAPPSSRPNRRRARRAAGPCRASAGLIVRPADDLHRLG